MLLRVLRILVVIFERTLSLRGADQKELLSKNRVLSKFSGKQRGLRDPRSIPLSLYRRSQFLRYSGSQREMR
jgi:hypothetical protein